jgi:hypothetical protein
MNPDLPVHAIVLAAMWRDCCWRAMLAVPKPMGDRTGGHPQYAAAVVELARSAMLVRLRSINSPIGAK